MDFVQQANTTVTPTGNGQMASNGDSSSDRPDQAAPTRGYAKYSAHETFTFMGYGPPPPPRQYTFTITGSCMGEANPPFNNSNENQDDDVGIAYSQSSVGSFTGSSNNNADANMPSYNVPVSSAGSFTPAPNSFMATYDVTIEVESGADPAAESTTPSGPPGGACAAVSNKNLPELVHEKTSRSRAASSRKPAKSGLHRQTGVTTYYGLSNFGDGYASIVYGSPT